MYMDHKKKPNPRTRLNQCRLRENSRKFPYSHLLSALSATPLSATLLSPTLSYSILSHATLRDCTVSYSSYSTLRCYCLSATRLLATLPSTTLCYCSYNMEIYVTLSYCKYTTTLAILSNSASASLTFSI